MDEIADGPSKPKYHGMILKLIKIVYKDMTFFASCNFKKYYSADDDGKC